MRDATTNNRRHGPDLRIRNKDLITAEDCRGIVLDAVSEALLTYHETVALERERAFRALPWWRRVLRGSP